MAHCSFCSVCFLSFQSPLGDIPCCLQLAHLDWFHHRSQLCRLLSPNGVELRMLGCWRVCSWLVFVKIADVSVCVQVRRLYKGGVWWAGPPCSSWIFLSRSTTGRSYIRPQGRALPLVSYMVLDHVNHVKLLTGQYSFSRQQAVQQRQGPEPPTEKSFVFASCL